MARQEVYITDLDPKVFFLREEDGKCFITANISEAMIDIDDYNFCDVTDDGDKSNPLFISLDVTGLDQNGIDSLVNDLFDGDLYPDGTKLFVKPTLVSHTHVPATIGLTTGTAGNNTVIGGQVVTSFNGGSGSFSVSHLPTICYAVMGSTFLLLV